jgi:hypothetical protein
MPERLGFSSAAATRSLSFSCLLTAASLAWPPGLTAMSTCRGHGVQGLQPQKEHRTVAATQPAGRLLLVFEHRWFRGLWRRYVITGNGHDACLEAAALKALRQGAQQLHTDAQPTDQGLGFKGLGPQMQLLTLKRCGRARSSFTRMHSPMSVAMLQCCTVGVNCTLQRSRSSISDHVNCTAARQRNTASCLLPRCR